MYRGSTSQVSRVVLIIITEVFKFKSIQVTKSQEGYDYSDMYCVITIDIALQGSFCRSIERNLPDQIIY